MNTNINDYINGLFEESPSLLIAVDTSYTIMATNKSYNEFAKKIYSVIPKVGIEFGDIFRTNKDNAVLNSMMDGFSTAFNGGRKVDIYKFDQGKLTNMYFEAEFYPIKNADSKIIGAGCVAREVTERENLLISLESNRKMFSLALRLANLAPWQFDLKNNVFVFNDDVYALYGTSVEKEGITMSPEVFAKKIILPEEISTVQKFFNDIQKLPGPESTIGLESRIVRVNDKMVRIIKVLAKVIKDKDGKIIELYGTNQDITEQRKTEDELKEKMAELEKFNKLFIDREIKMSELKEEIARLKEKTR